MSETDGTWLTKAEIARVRGITIASAYRLIRRQGWRRQPGNDGKIRVLVPSDWANGHGAGQSAVPSDVLSINPLTRQLAVPSAVPLTRPSDATSDRPSDEAGLVRLIEAANVRADEANRRADAALALADRTLVQLSEAAGRIEQVEHRADAAQQRADRADARTEAAEMAVELARVEAQAAEERAETLRAAHATELAQAQEAARIATDALNVARRAEEARKARGLVARLRAAWRGE